jgi:glycosyltransferase involved in cell wall biosynthesis/peptidoglycan/xylan/chitin deacetylase (PgdA/CDA1 family)
MFLSIIIPTHNRSESLAKALSALMAELNNATDAEVIVVDDNSNPACKNENSDLCKRFGARYVAHDTRRGAAAARNTGIKSCAGAWIAFLDDDVRVCPNWLGVLREKLPSLPGGVLGVEGRVDAEGGGLWDREVANTRGGLFLTCHCIYRAGVVKEENGFDEHFSGRYPSCEDHEFAARVLRRGRVVFEKNISVVHSARRVRCASYCAASFERIKAQLDAEFYFYVKHPDRYRQFRRRPTFFGTLWAILAKHTLTTLRRRPAGVIVRHPFQSLALAASCLMEQAYAWVLAPAFFVRFLKGTPLFFADSIDMQRTRELWTFGAPGLTPATFRMKRSIVRSLLFRLLRKPVYSAIPVLRRLGKNAAAKAHAPRCFLRIDDMFLDQTAAVETLCTILREKGVPFLAAITGDHLIDKRSSSLIDTILSSGGEIGMHGFSHQGTFGPFASEMLQLTFSEMCESIERVMACLPQSLRPVAFVPPFNAISRQQIYHAGTYFPIICGGPETARFTDRLFGPIALKNGSWYFPAFFPFYSTAAAILRSGALESLKRSGGIACVTLHMPKEAGNGFGDLRTLAQRLCGTAVSWRSLTK